MIQWKITKALVLIFCFVLNACYIESINAQGTDDQIIIQNMGEGKFLITKGFPYLKDENIEGSISIIGVDGGKFIVDKGSTLPVNVSGWIMPFKLKEPMKVALFPTRDEKMGSKEKDAAYMAAALGMIWEFQKSDMSFIVKDYIFLTKIQGAKIEFMNKGVLFQGFEITKNKK